jgi:hypothetical protein
MQAGDAVSEDDSEVIAMDIPVYRIHRILRQCTGLLKIRQTHASKNTSSTSGFEADVELSREGKKKRLREQLVCEAVAQLSMRVRNRKELRSIDGIPPDIFLEDGKRTVDGTPM